MTEIRDSVVPVGLDKHEQERLMVLVSADGTEYRFAEPVANSGLWHYITCHADDIQALFAWLETCKPKHLPHKLEITTIAALSQDARDYRDDKDEDWVPAGLWFPISGEIIPL
jgi:hypothetical protein